MSASKHFEKIAWTVTVVMLIITLLFMNGGALGLKAMAHTMGYETRLFDNTRVHTIDIVMDDWDEFIKNAASEEYYTASLVIDGEAYKNVGIRGKGNTSLSTVSSMNSDRYSFKIEFDHYDSSITYHGLDKLSLNNLIQDSTMMKDYLAYTMMNEFGAAAPLCSFVYITVGGEDWGLYLAVEGVEDSFLKRNYGSDYGELYKPDSMSFGGGRGNGKDFSMDDFINSAESSDTSDNESSMPDMGGFDPSSMFGSMPDMGNFDPSSMFGGMPDMGNFDFSQLQGGTQAESGSESRENFSFGGMGMFGMGSSDVKLQYVDDNPSSYSNIWNNAKTDVTQSDQLRLIESLKKLSEGEQLESVVDIEQVVRYFVVHNYVCNGDSYTGMMIHNYYLYEKDGRMSMIPWDYNLAYGTFQGGSGQSTVNTPIDAPVSGGSGEDRHMWSWILSDPTYTDMYHLYFAEFLNTVDMQSIIDDAYNLISPYVEKDPTAFYTCEEFETGVETLRRFCALRSESISMQLANGETTADMSYAEASGLSLSAMGSMGGGGFGGFGRMPERGDRNSKPQDTPSDSGNAQNADDQLPDETGAMSENADAFQIPGDFGNMMPDMGTMPENLDPSQIPGGFNGSMPDGMDFSPGTGEPDEGSTMPDMGTMPENFDPSQIPGGFNGSMPDGMDFSPGADKTSAQPLEESGTAPSAEPETTKSTESTSSRRDMQMPGGSFAPGMNAAASADQPNSNLIWLAASALILCLGLIVARIFRRY